MVTEEGKGANTVPGGCSNVTVSGADAGFSIDTVAGL